MFNNDNRIEGFAIDEQNVAYSTLTGRKNVLKKEALDKFVTLSKKIDCKEITKEETERFIKYTLEFKTRIPMRIGVSKDSINENQKEIDKLESVYKTLTEKKDRKIQIRNRVLLAGGIILMAGAAIHKGPAIMDKIVENDNIRFEQEQQESRELQEQMERNQEYQEALEQVEADQKAEQVENAEKQAQMQQYLEQLNQEDLIEQQKEIEEYRNFDERYTKIK